MNKLIVSDRPLEGEIVEDEIHIGRRRNITVSIHRNPCASAREFWDIRLSGPEGRIQLSAPAMMEIVRLIQRAHYDASNAAADAVANKKRKPRAPNRQW